MKSKSILLTSVISAALMVTINTAGASEAAHWDYEGAHGPSHWAAIDDANALCGSGKNQSPIDIVRTTEATLEDLVFDYQATASTMINNGHTVQYNFDEGSRLSVGGKAFALKQVHFHAPSENHINGQSYPLEAHFVHQSDDGALAVIAVMLSADADASNVAQFFALPRKAGESVILAKVIKAQSLLPSSRDYYRFSGSLTTPPCSEGVIWLVMKQPVNLSASDIRRISVAIGIDNNRPLQAHNARLILQ